jgi:hypothetical protein
MSLKSMWCCALQRDVPCVINREGDVVAVTCSERQANSRTCRVKARAFQDGLLGDLFRPAGWIAVEEWTPRCPLG